MKNKNVRVRKKTKNNPQQGTGIRCPACGGTSHVKSTNAMPEKSVTERYRKCDDCSIYFYTEEVFVRTTTPK